MSNDIATIEQERTTFSVLRTCASASEPWKDDGRVRLRITMHTIMSDYPSIVLTKREWADLRNKINESMDELPRINHAIT